MLAAVVRGDLKSVQDALKDGSDINSCDCQWGTSPLMAACAPTQRLEVLAFLLEDKKLDKELVNARGMTGLISTRQITSS
mmetsp:Transcript_5560/g.19531  ORF Transcript_5560/g.19531 Transcript_5560/m.19531 type:complete len:80 (-) Transcript_5560:1642-1881(-)